MITVYSVAYYHNKEHIITEHKFQNFDIACQVVGEVWAYAENNVYTIIDDREDL